MSERCPNPEELAAFCFGTLPPDRAEPLSHHIESCATCQDALETQDKSRDSVMLGVKSQPANVVDSPDVREIVAAVLNDNPWKPTRLSDNPAEEATVETSAILGQAEQTVHFDSLHVWLGIPPNQQPPDHYRLLGIDMFESNADVIESAADRQMAHVRTFQSGQRAEFAQRLLTQISAARVCLLNPQKKAEYDDELRRQQPASEAPAVLASDLPAKPETMGEYKQVVVGLGLATDAKLKQCLEALPADQRPGDVAGLARALVQGDCLTKFQAAAIYQGKWQILTLGDYVMLDRIGGGGMGDVYKALHRRMRVLRAIKVIKPELVDSAESVQRFQREVFAAAQLSHPNIVAAHDAGEDHGRHYLVMEFIDGEDLGDIVKGRGPLPVSLAADFIMQAARGLAYAHKKGTVHRDVKPGNLLLDADGVVKVSDLGLARLDADLHDAGGDGEHHLTTSDGKILGTVDFMAPEQAEDTHTVDQRADIYSLGCTFYRLLTGASPYPTGSTIQRMMAHQSAPIPKIRDKCPEVPAWVDEVFSRMVAKYPEDRPQTMDEVADLLSECLSGSEASAAPPAAPTPQIVAEDPLLRHVAKKKGPSPIEFGLALLRTPGGKAAAAGVLGSLLLVGIVATLAVMMIFRTPHGTFEVQVDGEVAPDVEVVAKQGGELIEVASAENNWTLSLKEGEYQLEVRGGGEDKFKIDKAVASITRGDKEIVRLSRTTVPTPSLPRVGGGTGVAETSDPKESTLTLDRKFEGSKGTIRAVALSPDGSLAASGSGWPQADNTVRVWDVASKDELHVWRGHKEGINSVAFSPAGNMLVSGDASGVVMLWQVGSDQPIRTFEQGVTEMGELAFTPDAKFVIAGMNEGRCVQVWDTAGKLLHTWEQDNMSVKGIAVLSDSRHVAAGLGDGTVRLLEIDTGKLIRKFQGPQEKDGWNGIWDVAISRDGRRLAASYQSRAVRVWDIASGEVVADIPNGQGGTHFVDFAGDNRHVVAVDGKGLFLIDTDTNRVVSTNSIQGSQAGALSSDGKFLLTAGGVAWSDGKFRGNDDYALRLWRLPENVWPNNDKFTLVRKLEQKGSQIYAVAWSPDGRWAMSGGGGRRVLLWDTATWDEPREFPGHEKAIICLAFSPDSKLAAVGDAVGKLVILDLQKREKLHEFEAHKSMVNDVAFTPDGQFLLSVSGDDESLRRWNVETGEAMDVIHTRGHAKAIAITPDGQQALTAGQSLQRWNLESGKEVAALRLSGTGLSSLAIAPDGSRAAAADDTGQIKIYDLASGDVQHKIQFGDAPVEGLAITADSRWLIAGSFGKSLGVIDLQTGKIIDERREQTHCVNYVALSPDGRHVLSGGGHFSMNGKQTNDGDFALRLWKLPKRLSPTLPLVLESRFEATDSPVTGIVPLADGRRFVSCGDELALWEVGKASPLWSIEPKDLSHARVIALSSGSETVATGYYSRGIHVWNLKDGSHLKHLAYPDAEEDKNVADLVFVDGGETLLAATWNGRVDAWSVDSGERRVLVQFGRGIRSIAVSPDGKTLFVGGGDHRLALFSAADGKLIRELSASGGSYDAAFSPDGKYLASGIDKSDIALWDVASGRLIRKFTGAEDNIISIAFSLDEKLLIAGAADRALRVWNIASGQLVAQATTQTQATRHAAALSDGRIVSGGGRYYAGNEKFENDGDYALRLWKLPESVRPKNDKIDLVCKFDGYHARVEGLAVFPAGNSFIAAERSDAGSILALDVVTGKPVIEYAWPDGGGRPTEVAISANGKSVAVGSSYGGRFVLYEEGREPRIFSGHVVDAKIGGLRFVPNQPWIVSGAYDGTIKVWDLNTGKELRSIIAGTPGKGSPNVYEIAVSPDGRYIVAQDKNEIVMWDLATLKKVRTLYKIGAGTLWNLDFSPDGARCLAALGGGELLILNVAQGGIEREFRGGQTHADAKFTVDGRFVIETGYEGLLRVWDIESGQPIATAQAQENAVLAVLPDGQHVVTVGGPNEQPADGDYSPRLWRLPDSVSPQNDKITLAGKLPGHGSSAKGADALATSADGQFLLSAGGADDRATLWNIATGKPVRSFAAATSVTGVALSPDGKWAACAEGSGRVSIYDIANGKSVAGFENGTTISALAFSPNSEKIIAAVKNDVVNVWDVELQKIVARHTPGGYIWQCEILPDNETAVLATSMGCKLWNIKTGEVEAVAHAGGGVSSVAMDRKGQILAFGLQSWAKGGDRHPIVVWDRTAQRELQRFKGNEKTTVSLHFLPDERHLISGGSDGTIRIWSLDTGEEIARQADLGHLASTVVPLSAGRAVSFGGYYDGADPDPLEGDYDVRLWRLPENVWPNEQKLSFVRKFEGHTGTVEDVAISPDGRWLASASGYSNGDESLRIWDLATGREVHQIKAHDGQVICVEFLPDGRLLSAGRDWKVRLWDVKDGKKLGEFDGLDRGVFSLAVSPDGRIVAAGDDQSTVLVWDVESGKVLQKYDKHENAVIALAVSPDGKQVISGGFGLDLVLWNVEDGKELGRFDDGSPGAITEVVFTADGKQIVTSSKDRSLSLWDVATQRELRQIRLAHHVQDVTLTPGGTHAVAAVKTGEIVVWNLSTGEIDASAKVEGVRLWTVATSPDGQYLAAAGGDNNENGTLVRGRDYHIRLWRLPESVSPKVAMKSLIEEARFETTDSPVTGIAALADGWRFVSCGDGLALWEVCKATPLWSIKPADLSHALSIALSPGGETVATGYYNRGIRLWNLKDGSLLQSLVYPDDEKDIHVPDLVFVDDGKMLLAATWNGRVDAWLTETGERKELLEFGHGIRAIAASPDGKTFFVGGGNRRQALFNVANGRLLRELSESGGSYDAAFSPDGKYVASGIDKSDIALWDVASGRLVRRLVGAEENIISLAFSPDGKLLIAGAADRMLSVRDVATGQLVAHATTQTQATRYAAVLSDGQIVSGGGRFYAGDGKFENDGDLGRPLHPRRQAVDHRQPRWTHFVLESGTS